MKMRNDIFLMYLALSVLIIIFATFFKFSPLKNTARNITPTSTANPSQIPVVTIEKLTNTSILVTGTVPPGWMFEGSFPLKLLTKGKKLIKTVVVQEKIPDTWTSGKPIEFSSTLSGLNLINIGFVVIEKDNPSGLEENAKTFEVPVSFTQTKTSYVCPSNGWIDCMPKVVSPGEKDTSNYSCSNEAIAWYEKNCPNFQGVAY